MDLYPIVLFLHIIAAILLVGGSSWSHVASALVRRARTVDGARTQVAFITTFVRASMPLAILTFLAGAYMATDAGLWGQGWLVVSLVLFLGVGAASGAVVEPVVKAMAETLDAAPDGPMTPALLADLENPRMAFTLAVFAAADVALVFLMTNKPGLVASVTTATVALGLGALYGAREARTHRLPGVSPA